MNEIVNIYQYIKELKIEVGTNHYMYYNLPAKLKLKKFHFRALHRGYIECVTFGGSSKPSVWRVVA